MNFSMTSSLLTPYPGTQDCPDSWNEVNLVKAAQKGDLEAFTSLVIAYQDRIFNLAVRILGDEEVADDITQSTFMTAYTQLPRFRNGSFHGWLYRIATNACYDEFRQQKRHPVLSMDDKYLFDECIVPVYQLQYSDASPEREAERDEQARIIQSALGQLKPDQRIVIVLVDQQELDYQEAARVLHIPIGTVKSRLSRGRAHLHAILKKYNENGLIEVYN
jgi:RNA polymerase sigma-70 factor (ECF subfamily)